MTEGFFTRKQTESRTRPSGKSLSCISCGLYKDVITPKMKPFGNFKKGIMNIGEMPTEIDDKRGKQFQSKGGKLLQKTYSDLGIDLFEDCININAANCRPTNEDDQDRSPTNNEVDNCRRIVLAAIEQYKPKVIILLGGVAIYSLIGHRWKKDLGGVQKWRGWTIPDQDFKAWICPTYHPAFIMRQNENQNYKIKDEKSPDSIEMVVWRKDLKQAFECVKKELPIYKEPTIDVITDLHDLEYWPIGNVKARILPKEIAFDYETTGLKPHADGHRIVCVSIADGEDHVYVFMMPQSRNERKPFIDILLNPEIGKIAQNIKYENNWTQVRLKTEVQGWIWDTMQATHILDNRSGITSLKFQVFVIFGIVDYDSEIAPYLKSNDEDNANAINNIMKLIEMPGGKEKLMKYCALDSIFEFRLSKIQRQLMKV
jgi:uracil-DNA glycosylase family 4